MKDFTKSIRTNNSKVSNKATVLKDGNVWVVLYANETKSQEFETEEEAREFAKKVGNSKVGNSSKFDALESIIQEASMYAENAYRRLNSPYSATNIISDLSHCKQACDIAIKRAQEYDKELQSKK